MILRISTIRGAGSNTKVKSRLTDMEEIRQKKHNSLQKVNGIVNWLMREELQMRNFVGFSENIRTH